MQRKSKRMAMIVAIVLAALMILPLLITGLAGLIPEAQGAPTQQSINELKKNLNALRETKKITQEEIRAKKGDLANVEQQKALYDEQTANVELSIEYTIELITQISLSIAERELELAGARAREEELREIYIQRIRAMESVGEISYLSILLQAESLTDFLTRWDSFQEIMRRDQDLAAELLAARVEIEETIAQLEEDRREERERRRELAETQVELAVLSAEVDAMMAEYMAEMAKLLADEKKIAEAEAKADKELKEQEAELARIIEEQKKRNNSKYVGGAYLWPVPGHYTISSGFGMRKHPVYKVQRHHTGIDIPAPKGTPIVAANSGEIIIKTKSSGYGNYIVVDHGGGQATLYAHMSSFAKVNAGARVKAGDTIGYVGSTGVSTGNHLHFEIIINGTPVKPDEPGRLLK